MEEKEKLIEWFDGKIVVNQEAVIDEIANTIRDICSDIDTFTEEDLRQKDAELLLDLVNDAKKQFYEIKKEQMGD